MSSLIAGLLLAALVLLALFLWYVAIEAIVQVIRQGVDAPGTNVPGQKVVSALALSTARAFGLGG